MKAIVTGASGFVGSALVKELVSNNIETVCVDYSFNAERLPKSDLVKFISLSVENIEELKNILPNESYDMFYHFAWVGSAGTLRNDENVQIKNALWTVKCLRTAKALGCKKFICAGSIMEYEVQFVVYAPDTKPALSYIYGAGKVLAHELCKPIANDIGIELVWAYITNAYGVGELSPRFINTTLRKIYKGEKLEFTAATQNYDFVYIDDVAKAFYLLGLYGKANRGYIIGSGNAKPLKEFIMEMVNANSLQSVPIFGNVPFTGINLPLEIFSTKYIKEDCGFSPKVSFGEGTKRTMQWLMEVDN